MKTLEYFGNPPQAASVPAFVERSVGAQVSLAHCIMEYRCQLDANCMSIAYHRCEDKPDKNGLPTYCAIVRSMFSPTGHIEARTLDATLVSILMDRFDKRVHIGEPQRYDETSGQTYHFVEWGLWLDPELTEMFLREDVPTFANNEFSQFCMIPIVVEQQIYPFDFQAFRQKMGFYGVVGGMELGGPHALSAIMPMVGEHVEAERLSFLREHVNATWGWVKAYSPDESFKWVPDPPIKLEQKQLPKAALLREATTFEVSMTLGKVAHGRSYRIDVEEPELTRSRCEHLFCGPTGSCITESRERGWIYSLCYGDALVVIEGIEHNAKRLVLIPGSNVKELELKRFVDVVLGHI
jgi:hypothetical protein